MCCCGKPVKNGEPERVSHGLCRLCELLTYERDAMLTPLERIELAVRRWIVNAAKGGNC